MGYRTKSEFTETVEIFCSRCGTGVKGTATREDTKQRTHFEALLDALRSAQLAGFYGLDFVGDWEAHDHTYIQYDSHKVYCCAECMTMGLLSKENGTLF